MIINMGLLWAKTLNSEASIGLVWIGLDWIKYYQANQLSLIHSKNKEQERMSVKEEHTLKN